MKKLIAALLLLILAFSLSATAYAADDTNGTITGKVVNKTANGTPVDKVQVTLQSYVGGTDQPDKTAVVDSKGSFSFTSLSTASNSLYVVTAQFQGTEYHSGMITFQSGQTAQDIELDVFDTTTSDANVRDQNLHFLIDIDPSQKVVTVSEVHNLSNTGDKAYIGSKDIGTNGKKEVMRVNLPKSVTGIDFSQDFLSEEVVQVPEGFVIVKPVSPGTQQLFFSYQLAYTGNSVDIQRTVAFPIDSLDVFVKDVGATLKGNNIGAPTTLQTQSGNYLRYSGQALKAGDPIALTLSNLPAGGLWDVLQNRLVLIGVIVAVVVIVLLALLLFLRWFLRRRQAGSPRGKRQELLESLADLDDQWEEGEITEEEYDRRRAEIKERLRATSRPARGRAAVTSIAESEEFSEETDEDLEEEAEETAISTEDAQAEQERLAIELTELEEQFEEAQITRRQYERQKAAILSKLKELPAVD